MFFSNWNCCRYERCRCNRPENKYCCDKRDHDNREDHNDKSDCGCHRENKKCCYIGQDKKEYSDKDNKNYYSEESYYGREYLGNYSEQNNIGYYGNNKDYDDKQDFDYNNEKSYTPNWEEDKYCKCGEKNDKHTENNKCCKPVSFICFPWYK